MKNRSDSELFYLLKAEHATREAAFAEIYQRYSSRIFLYCRKILGDSVQADDIFQETFLLFLKSAEKEREMTNLPAYLLRIARNLCLNVKRSQRHVTVSFEEFYMPVQDNQVESDELARMVTAALDLLGEEQREALVLQMYHDLSYQEIGDIMNVPVTTVRNWIVRAKAKVRVTLSPYMEAHK